MQPVIPKSNLPSCVLSRPPPQWLVSSRGWAFREDSLEEGKLSLDLEGERGPRRGVCWRMRMAPCGEQYTQSQRRGAVWVHLGNSK